MVNCCKRFLSLIFLSVLVPTPVSANSLNDGAKLSGTPAQISTSSTEQTFSEIKTVGLSFDPSRSRRIKGWDHVYELLVGDGVSPDYLEKVLSDPRMPRAETLYFAINPSESRHLYRKHNTTRARKNALRFYRNHRDYFQAASNAYSVPEAVILAILQVETQCGSYTGGDRVFPRLLRLAYASAPQNVELNFQKKLRLDRSLKREAVVARASWLEKTFLPHAAAALSVAKAKGIDPLELRGSGAGAVGLPQFLPGHYFNFGVDADNNGVVDLYTAPDAIVSVAKYLNAHGWRKTELPPTQQREVIWHYNHSKPYIDTVLTMAGQLAKGIEKISAGELADEEQTSVKKAKTSRSAKSRGNYVKVKSSLSSKK